MAELDIAALRKMAHDSLDQAIDQWSAGVAPTDSPVDAVADTPEAPAEEASPARELPKDKRVVRTKQSGDRVYLLDEIKKTRQWITNPEVLAKLGFEMGDVKDVADKEFLDYTLGSPVYRIAETNANA